MMALIKFVELATTEEERLSRDICRGTAEAKCKTQLKLSSNSNRNKGWKKEYRAMSLLLMSWADRLLGRESLLFRHLAQTCRRTWCRRFAQQAKSKKIVQKSAFPSNFDLKCNTNPYIMSYQSSHWRLKLALNTSFLFGFHLWTKSYLKEGQAPLWSRGQWTPVSVDLRVSHI